MALAEAVDTVRTTSPDRRRRTRSSQRRIKLPKPSEITALTVNTADEVMETKHMAEETEVIDDTEKNEQDEACSGKYLEMAIISCATATSAKTFHADVSN